MNKEELNEIDLSIESLKLSLRLSNAINKNAIDLDVLRKGMILDNVNGVVIPKENNLTKDDIYQDANNLQVSALGTCILCLDKTLDLFVMKNPKSEKNFDKIRSIIYQVRNAYAHNPFKPIWHSKPAYLKEYQINIYNSKSSIDLTSMNGKNFAIEDIGGFTNLFNIIEICREFIASNPRI